MSATLSLTEQQIFTAVGNVLSGFGLTSANGLTVAIIQGQVNRAPEPSVPDFVVMWPLSREPLSVPGETSTDVEVTGSIASNVMTVTAVVTGPLAPGQTIYGEGVRAGCQIIAQLSGTTGGIGTYSTTPTPDVGSEELYCGVTTVFEPKEMTIQADIHGPSSADNAERIKTLWRSIVAVQAFQSQPNFDGAPLYASSPRQIRFDNAEQQVEERWSIDLCFEINPTVTVTQQFADQLVATAISVEAAYPV
jgi:hypothetical protein